MADSKPISRARSKPRDTRRAFTLVELMVAAGISSFVLAGVLTASMQLMRSGVRLAQYSEMDSQLRSAFEQLGVDLKAASAFTFNSATDITVTVAKSDGTTAQYTYAWNSSTKIFYRVPGASSASTSGRLQLASGVSALAFSRFDTSGNSASTDNATKRVKISLTATRSASGAARTTTTDANTYTLRNKPVS
ncbi:MAG: type II secretion system protein [Verrucomicrobia bacterium]|nr:type II secretion system protein [Verrucomicrobiota bacterium]